MKIKILLFFVVIIFSIAGCKQSTEPTEIASSDTYVNLEIESHFENDAVKLLLDGEALVDSKVTTNYTIDLAWSSGLRKLLKGSVHKLQFGISEYGLKKDYDISTTNDTSTILIRFDKSRKQIDIMQSKGMILRE